MTRVYDGMTSPSPEVKTVLVFEIAKFLNENSGLLENLGRNDLRRMTVGTLVHLHMALASCD